LRYPVLPGVAFAVWIAWTAACYRFPSLWVGVVPALMPVLGFAPWTGWLIVEELDLMLAGVVAAGYARFAFGIAIEADAGSPPDGSPSPRIPLASVVPPWRRWCCSRRFSRPAPSVWFGVFSTQGRSILV
ncbi:MAG: hypothetical protein MUF54_24230, partial [Polyangiaceae bacterium]|nr:hypothetical protein [Polyangiaceae bacterium]